jgi:hypothetical protein
MKEPEAAAVRKSKSFWPRVLSLWQTLVVLFLILILAVLLGETRKLTAPGAPTTLYWGAVVFGLLVAVAHLPPVFRRWPRRVVPLVYLAIPTLFVGFGVTLEQLDEAWTKTPAGAAEAKVIAEQESEDAAMEKERAELDAQSRYLQDAAERQERAAKDAQERQAKLEKCFSMFGHRLPKLEEQVKSGLGNPDAFKQLKTEAMPSDVDGYNVLMTFMAQNRMGALWTYQLRATVDPDTCDVTNIEPELRDS